METSQLIAALVMAVLGIALIVTVLALVESIWVAALILAVLGLAAGWLFARA